MSKFKPVGKNTSTNENTNLRRLLREYKDVFEFAKKDAVFWKAKSERFEAELKVCQNSMILIQM